MKHAILFSALLFGVLSQFLMKFRVNALGDEMDVGSIRFLVAGLSDFGVWVAIGLSFAAGLGWMLTLRYMDVSYAYPWTALIYVVVTVGGVFLFDETVNSTQLIGVALICAGVLVSAQGA